MAMGRRWVKGLSAGQGKTPAKGESEEGERRSSDQSWRGGCVARRERSAGEVGACYGAAVAGHSHTHVLECMPAADGWWQRRDARQESRACDILERPALRSWRAAGDAASEPVRQQDMQARPRFAQLRRARRPRSGGLRSSEQLPKRPRQLTTHNNAVWQHTAAPPLWAICRSSGCGGVDTRARPRSAGTAACRAAGKCSAPGSGRWRRAGERRGEEWRGCKKDAG